MKYECARRDFGASQWIASFLRKKNKQQFVDARTCRRTSALASQRKDNQILRTEILAGGETGGECMTGAGSDEPESKIIPTVGSDGRPCQTTSVRCFESMSDELLIADK